MFVLWLPHAHFGTHAPGLTHEHISHTLKDTRVHVHTHKEMGESEFKKCKGMVPVFLASSGKDHMVGGSTGVGKQNHIVS